MNLQETLLTLGGLLITALLTWITDKVNKYLKSKTLNENSQTILTRVTMITTEIVKATYQTYVQALKNKDMFTKESQEEALRIAKEETLKLLSNESKKFIIENYGDIDKWLINKIEAAIYDLKN